MNMFRWIALCFLLISTTVASAQAPTQVPPTSRLKAIASTKSVKIAYRTDARPFSFVNEKNEPVGFSIDVCRLVVSSLQSQLGIPNLKIEWVPATVQNRFSTLSRRHDNT